MYLEAEQVTVTFARQFHFSRQLDEYKKRLRLYSYFTSLCHLLS